MQQLHHRHLSSESNTIKTTKRRITNNFDTNKKYAQKKQFTLGTKKKKEKKKVRLAEPANDVSLFFELCDKFLPENISS